MGQERAGDEQEGRTIPATTTARIATRRRTSWLRSAVSEEHDGDLDRAHAHKQGQEYGDWFEVHLAGHQGTGAGSHRILPPLSAAADICAITASKLKAAGF